MPYYKIRCLPLLLHPQLRHEHRRKVAIDTTHYHICSILNLAGIQILLITSMADTHLGVDNGLGTATTAGSSATATVLATEIATGIALATVAVTLETTTATRSAVAAAGTEAGAAVVTGSLGATRLNDNVLSIHGVRVARDGSLVSLKRLILNECTVLKQLVTCMTYNGVSNSLHTFWRLMSK